MWNRLSESPEKLDLDRRAEEEPEDLFVRLCNTGRKRDVNSALKANLCETIGNMEEKEKGAALRFMQRAIRLCDIIGASNCKPFLEMLLLYNSKDYWGEDLEELQELATRTLSGMPKEASDFSYWSRIADKHNTSLSYALNAMIEIDLDRGIEKLVQVYFDLQQEAREDEVNWEIIVQIAADTHGSENVGDALDKVFATNPLEFQLFVPLVAKIPSLRPIGKRERKIENIASYAEEALVKEPEHIDLQSLMSFFNYQVPKQTTIKSHKTPEKEKLIETQGKLGYVSDILFQPAYPMSWKSYPLGRNMIKSYEN